MRRLSEPQHAAICAQYRNIDASIFVSRGIGDSRWHFREQPTKASLDLDYYLIPTHTAFHSHSTFNTVVKSHTP